MKRTVLELRKAGNRIWVDTDGFGVWGTKARIEEGFLDLYDEHDRVVATFSLGKFDVVYPTELRYMRLLEEEVANA
jgi:hypothetical protein